MSSIFEQNNAKVAVRKLVWTKQYLTLKITLCACFLVLVYDFLVFLNGFSNFTTLFDGGG